MALLRAVDPLRAPVEGALTIVRLPGNRKSASLEVQAGRLMVNVLPGFRAPSLVNTCTTYSGRLETSPELAQVNPTEGSSTVKLGRGKDPPSFNTNLNTFQKHLPGTVVMYTLSYILCIYIYTYMDKYKYIYIHIHFSLIYLSIPAYSQVYLQVIIYIYYIYIYITYICIDTEVHTNYSSSSRAHPAQISQPRPTF